MEGNQPKASYRSGIFLGRDEHPMNLDIARRPDQTPESTVVVN